MIPWKWMAIEYLKNDYFTITSDVWSFAIVAWEILSLGKNPYGHQSYDEVVNLLEDGYRLPCPTETNDITSWSPHQFYTKISNECFVEDPTERCTFTKVVEIIETELTEREIRLHETFQGKYKLIHESNYIKHKS